MFTGDGFVLVQDRVTLYRSERLRGARHSGWQSVWSSLGRQSNPSNLILQISVDFLGFLTKTTTFLYVEQSASVAWRWDIFVITTMFPEP